MRDLKASSKGKNRSQTEARTRRHKWKIISVVNLTLGLILWFGFSTDFSWVGTVSDFCYPPAVAFLSLCSLMFTSKATRRIYKLACLPSLIGGGITLMLMVVMIIPPFTLGSLFVLDEIKHETWLQRALSPNGARVANVYFRGVGAYAGGNGRIYVRIRNRWLPFVERDIYEISQSYAHEDTYEYLYWKDNNTLYISGEPALEAPKNRELNVGVIQFRIPVIFSISFNLTKYLLQS